MQQTLLNLLTAGMTDLKATTMDLKPGTLPAGDSLFGTLLSQAMDEGSPQVPAGAVGETKPCAPLDLPALLPALLGKDAAAFEQTLQTSAGQEAHPASSAGWKVAGAWCPQASAAAAALPAEGTTKAGSATVAPQTVPFATDATWSATTQAGAEPNPEQQLQDLIMGLVALVMMKDAGAQDQQAAATASVPGEQEAAAEQGNVPVTGPIGLGTTGLSQRSKVASNDATSGKTSETDTRHLLDTLALLLFAGLEAAKQEPDTSPAAPGETLPSLPKEGRAGTGTATGPALKAQAAAAGPATSPGPKGPGTAALPGGESKGFTAHLPGAGTDAAVTGGKTMVRAEFALDPAAASAGENSLTLRVSVGSAVTSAQTSLAGQTVGSAQESVKEVVKEAGGGHDDGVVTVVRELTPLLLENRDGNASHDPGTGKERSGERQSYPAALDGHVSMNSEPAQEQQVSGQSASSGMIERFDRIMEQVGTGSAPHDMTVRLTVGNEDSLVLGLKDLGQTVTVEIRGSNQGMINLLQSQRDVIISHLEGKDISANIIIDPNASGTPERRDRRETKQRTFAARGKVGGGFDGILEIFA